MDKFEKNIKEMLENFSPEVDIPSFTEIQSKIPSHSGGLSILSKGVIAIGSLAAVTLGFLAINSSSSSKALRLSVQQEKAATRKHETTPKNIENPKLTALPIKPDVTDGGTNIAMNSSTPQPVTKVTFYDESPEELVETVIDEKSVVETESNNPNGNNENNNRLDQNTPSATEKNIKNKPEVIQNNENALLTAEKSEEEFTSEDARVADVNPGTEESQEIYTPELKVTVPNIFTPNGDGYNDFYRIQVENARAFNIIIRDIEGNEVFRSNDANEEWDGRNIYGEVVPGKYYVIYSVVGEGTQSKKGQRLIELK